MAKTVHLETLTITDVGVQPVSRMLFNVQNFSRFLSIRFEPLYTNTIYFHQMALRHTTHSCSKFTGQSLYIILGNGTTAAWSYYEEKWKHFCIKFTHNLRLLKILLLFIQILQKIFSKALEISSNIFLIPQNFKKVNPKFYRKFFWSFYKFFPDITLKFSKISYRLHWKFQ